MVRGNYLNFFRLSGVVAGGDESILCRQAFPTVNDGNEDFLKMRIMHLHRTAQTSMFGCFLYPGQTVGVKSRDVEFAFMKWDSSRYESPHSFFGVTACPKHGFRSRSDRESDTAWVTERMKLGNRRISASIYDLPFVHNDAAEFHLLASRIK